MSYNKVLSGSVPNTLQEGAAIKGAEGDFKYQNLGGEGGNR